MLSAVIHNCLAARPALSDDRYARGNAPLFLSYWAELPLSEQPLPSGRGRPVSRRSKPSSRSPLMGEQPHPWPLLQDQDGKSRHRNLIGNFFPDQTMSSPPALSSIGGSAYDGVAFLWPSELCCHGTSERAASSGGLGHLIAPQNSLRAQSLRGHTD